MTPTYTARILSRINEVTESDWDAHLPDGRHPFLSWRFLNACEQSGSATEDTGWAPRHIWLEDEAGKAVGCAPFYAKTHSQGEYVFDHSWANAMAQAGLDYYPKLQGSVPFTPATGPRLLTQDKDAKIGLVSTMIQACQDWEYSGVHLTFLQEDDLSVLKEIGFAHREDRQFHFINRGYESFDDFLASLASRKRKNIRKERKAANDGITIKRLTGDDLKPEHWDIFWRCYLDTTQRKWGRPYLTRQFFEPDARNYAR